MQGLSNDSQQQLLSLSGENTAELIVTKEFQ